MGIITNLIEAHHRKDIEAKTAEADALKTVLQNSPNDKAREWALQGLNELAMGGGGGKKGKGGGAGGGGDKQKGFHPAVALIGALSGLNPFSAGGGTKQTVADIQSKKPQGNLSMSTEDMINQQALLDQKKQEAEQKRMIEVKRQEAELAANQKKKERQENVEAFKEAQKGAHPMYPVGSAAEKKALYEIQTGNKLPVDEKWTAGSMKNVWVKKAGAKGPISLVQQMTSEGPVYWNSNHQLVDIGEGAEVSTRDEKATLPTGLRSAIAIREILGAPSGTYDEATVKGAQDEKDRLELNRKLAIERVHQLAQGGQPIPPDMMRELAHGEIVYGLQPPRFYGSNSVKLQSDYQRARASELGEMGGEAGAQRAEYKGESANLGSLLKTRGTLRTAEKGTLAEIDRAVTLGRMVPRTSSAKFNSLEQLIKSDWTDDPELARYKEAVLAARSRYNQMIINLKGTGTATNQVRAENAQEVLNRAFAQKSFEAAAQEMKTGIGNVMKGIDDTVTEAQGSLRDFGRGGAGGDAAKKAEGQPKATHRFNPATGKVEEIKQ